MTTLGEDDIAKIIVASVQLAILVTLTILEFVDRVSRRYWDLLVNTPMALYWGLFLWVKRRVKS